MSHVTDAFEDLAQAFRVLLEANDVAHRQGLLQVDRAEAVGNIDTALAAVLNAFHSLYDALDKESHGALVDWYNTAPLALVLALRNARHHNHAKKIRTMYSYYGQEAKQLGSMEMYVLVDFPAQEDGADTFDVYMSWHDLRALFSMPSSQSRVKPATAALIQKYLGSDRFAGHAKSYGLAETRVFFNVVPLLVNAAQILVPLIKDLVRPRSTESKAFLMIFENSLPADTSKHDVNCGPIALIE